SLRAATKRQPAVAQRPAAGIARRRVPVGPPVAACATPGEAEVSGEVPGEEFAARFDATVPLVDDQPPERIPAQPALLAGAGDARRQAIGAPAIPPGGQPFPTPPVPFERPAGGVVAT